MPANGTNNLGELLGVQLYDASNLLTNIAALTNSLTIIDVTSAPVNTVTLPTTANQFDIIRVALLNMTPVTAIALVGDNTFSSINYNSTISDGLPVYAEWIFVNGGWQNVGCSNFCYLSV